MATIYHKTSSIIKGPFLIDASQLEALDNILNEEWIRFETEYAKALDAAVEKEFQKDRASEIYKHKSDDKLRTDIKDILIKSHDFEKGRRFVITLANGSRLVFPDIESAFREPLINEKDITGFVAVIEGCRDRKCTISVGERWKESEVEVKPSDDNFVQETFTVLKNWQQSIRPPLWQTLWRDWSIAIWYLWIIAILCTFTYVKSSHVNSIKADFTHKAYELASNTNTFTPENQNEAMRLLLMGTYGVYPDNAKSTIPNWYYVILFAGFAYCVALSFSPKVAIGIGQGEKKV